MSFQLIDVFRTSGDPRISAEIEAIFCKDGMWSPAKFWSSYTGGMHANERASAIEGHLKS